MHPLYKTLADSIAWTGDTRTDMVALLTVHRCPGTREHSLEVADEALRLADRYGVDRRRAEEGALLHDVSAVWRSDVRLEVARALGVDILPEEAQAPMILHQKLSAVIARELFGVTDEEVLGAIACHTTLERGATTLEKVVFLADKIAWDQPGRPPYLDGLLEALDTSLDAAVLHYLQYLWDRRDALLVVHPWFVEAYEELSEKKRTARAGQTQS